MTANYYDPKTWFDHAEEALASAEHVNDETRKLLLGLVEANLKVARAMEVLRDIKNGDIKQ